MVAATNDEVWQSSETVLMESGAEVLSWLHKETGARLRLVSTEGPMANLYAVVATEAVNTEWGAKSDDGLPHTLEHLVFLGSETYPYKGVLDKLANRCLARGTNAWTDVDHTAYTATTAGSAGLMTLLPIYLDHILNPTLTEAGFVTEVHHVTASGEDKGVVYCEMQGRENAAESLAERACLSALYPGSGESSETGGLCANLRVLTNDKVQQYHKDMYRPDNLCLVVTGCVEPSNLLEVTHQALSKYASSKVGGERPWATDPPPPVIPKEPIVVEFPSDGDAGLVVLAWRGERYESYFEDAKNGLLWSYLTDGPASPLSKAFVNSGDCSGVYPGSDRFRIGYRQLWFEDVERLNEIEAKFDASLPKEVDVDRMRDVIERAKRRTTASTEDDPATCVVSPVIKHFLYGTDRDDSSFLNEIDALGLLEAVSKVGQDEWNKSLERIRSSPRLCVVAKPSKAAAEKQRDDEERRFATNTQTQGLEKAIEFNERSIPTEMLSSVTSPDVAEAKEKMFTVERIRKGSRWSLDHVDSTKFVRLDICADTRHLGVESRRLLPLLGELLFKSPVKQPDGTVMPYDDAVDMLRRETVSYSAGIGLGGSGTADFFFAGSKLERGRLATGAMVASCAANALFTPDRVSTAVQKLTLELQSELRDGNSVARNALRSLAFDEDSNQGLLVLGAQKAFLDSAKFACSPLGQFLGKRDKLVDELYETRRRLFSRAQGRVAGDLKNSQEDWSKHNIDPLISFVDEFPPNISKERNYGKFALVGVSSLEGGSAFLMRCGPGPGYNEDDESELAALCVCIEYLTALEGDFWTQIRGAGLAYGAGLRADPNNKLIHFSLYRSADPAKALAAARRVVFDYESGNSKIRDLDLENARGSLASGLVESEKTRSQALAASWRRSLLGLAHDRDKNFLDSIARVDKQAALDALVKYVAPMFKDSLAITAVACAPAKLNALSKDLYTDTPITKYKDILQLTRDNNRQRSRLLGKKKAIGAAAAAAALVAVIVVIKLRRSN